LEEVLDVRDLRFLVLEAEKKILMRKQEILRLTGLAFGGGNQLNDELTGLNYALRQISREQKGLPPVVE